MNNKMTTQEMIEALSVQLLEMQANNRKLVAEWNQASQTIQYFRAQLAETKKSLKKEIEHHILTQRAMEGLRKDKDAQLAEKERECERLRKALSASPHRSDCARDPFRILAGMSEAFSKCTCEHRRALENDDER